MCSWKDFQAINHLNDKYGLNIYQTKLQLHNAHSRLIRQFVNNCVYPTIIYNTPPSVGSIQTQDCHQSKHTENVIKCMKWKYIANLILIGKTC